MKVATLLASLAPFLAKDAKPEDITAAVDAQMALDKSAKDKKAADKAAADKAAKDKAAKDALGVGAETTIIHNVTGDEDDMDADDEDNEDPNEGKNTMDKKAMDAAIKLAVDGALRSQAALHQARRDVESIIGVVAYDSAAEVYKAALTKLEVATDGIHPSAYGAMLKQAVKASSAPLALDSAGGKVKTMTEAFPALARFSK